MEGLMIFEKIVTDENLLKYRRECRQDIRKQAARIRKRLDDPDGITKQERDNLRRGVVYLRWELRQIDSLFMVLSLMQNAALLHQVEKGVPDEMILSDD